MTAAWELPLDPTEKLVLLSLADWVNEEAGRNLCWPSIETLVKKCHTSESTIKRCLRSLEAAGHITRDFRKGATTYYYVHPGTGRGVNLTGVTHDPPGGSPMTPNTEEIQKPSRAKALSGRAKSKTSYPELDHELRVSCVQWAVKEMGWTAGAAGQEFHRFKDRNLSVDGRYSDWLAAWRNWCRSPFCKTEKAPDPFKVGPQRQYGQGIEPPPLVLR